MRSNLPYTEQGFFVGLGAADTIEWYEFEARPGEMESVTSKGSPIKTTKFLEAKARIRERQRREREAGGKAPMNWFTSKVLGRQPQDKWPMDLSVFRGHSSYVNDVAFSPDGKHLATGSDDKTARVWEVASGACVATLEGHSDGVTGVAFSPVDGKFLATASGDNTARVWEVAEEK